MLVGRYVEMDFNSHPHEEDDNLTRWFLPLVLYFNSHPHEEDDPAQTYLSSRNCISTHILMKRMTSHAISNRHIKVISTHILMKRMTFRSTACLYGRLHFNSHPHEEDDYDNRDKYRSDTNFNSHPHEEDD